MKTFLNSILATAVVALPGLLASGGAAAQATYNWNLGGSTCNATAATYPTLNSAACTAGSPAETATMTAWGGTGTTFTQGTIGNFDPSGMGAYTGSSETGTNGHHAFDNMTSNCGSTGTTTTNCGKATELMLISFGPYKVRLTDVAIGWWGADADVSILRWDGAGAPPTGSLMGAGWTLVGNQDLLNTGAVLDNPNIAGVDTGGRQSTINLGNQVSSYWMISTYYGTASTTSSGALGIGNDAFKLLNFSASICTTGVTGGSVAGTGSTAGNGGTCNSTTTAVSEPTMLATLGLALFGATVSRRRARRNRV